MCRRLAAADRESVGGVAPAGGGAALRGYFEPWSTVSSSPSSSVEPAILPKFLAMIQKPIRPKKATTETSGVMGWKLNPVDLKAVTPGQSEESRARRGQV